jgi:hypothetical protein
MHQVSEERFDRQFAVQTSIGNCHSDKAGIRFDPANSNRNTGNPSLTLILAVADSIE